MSEHALRRIERLDRLALLRLWRKRYGAPPPRLSQAMMRRMLAWDAQTKEQGGLSGAARRALAAALKRDGPRPLNPGTRLIRVWRGVVHEVEVVEGGYRWRGDVWRSLSAIAAEIAGTKWSGPRFFGLRRS